MNIAYVDGSNCNLVTVKAYGFDTVCGGFTKDQLDMMQRINLKAIYAGPFIEHPAIAAYYLYDEPDLNKISIADQDSKIAEYRALTNKPLAIACIEQTKRLCSVNYDWYMLDIYYMTEIGPLRKLINYVNAAFSTYIIRALYPNKKLIPIVGVFDDAWEYKYSQDYSKNFLKFAIKFRSYFRWTDDQAIFIFSEKIGDDTRFTHGVLCRDEYKIATQLLNSEEKEQCWWITSKLLLGTAHVTIWVRRWIKDEWIAKVNTWLPKSMKMKL